jgi:hypothetical protein
LTTRFKKTNSSFTFTHNRGPPALRLKPPLSLCVP